MENKSETLRLLFIGNSHTFVNAVPKIVRDRAIEAGFAAEVTMIAHGGWYLWQHVKEPDVSFNIRYGNYDYVILQEHSHPFDRLEDYKEAAATLVAWIKEAGAKPVIYGTWSQRVKPEMQQVMNDFNAALVKDLDTLYAPVGEGWWNYMKLHPELDLYYMDGEHASPAGSAYAADVIWKTIREDKCRG